MPASPLLYGSLLFSYLEYLESIPSLLDCSVHYNFGWIRPPSPKCTNINRIFVLKLHQKCRSLLKQIANKTWIKGCCPNFTVWKLIIQSWSWLCTKMHPVKVFRKIVIFFFFFFFLIQLIWHFFLQTGLHGCNIVYLWS